MQILNVKQTDWVSAARKHIMNGSHCIFHTVIESPVVLVHSTTQIDLSICTLLRYDVYEDFHNGGTIVTNPGDVGFGIFDSVNNNWSSRFKEYLVNWLRGKGLEASADSNDILVDGYKVCATCVTRYGTIDYTSILVGINTNLEHIKQICKKPMVKIPKGLSEYGITTEEVEHMFLDFCNSYEQKSK